MHTDDSSLDKAHEEVLQYPEISYNEASQRYIIRVELSDEGVEYVSNHPTGANKLYEDTASSAVYLEQRAEHPQAAKMILDAIRVFSSSAEIQ